MSPGGVEIICYESLELHSALDIVGTVKKIFAEN